MYFNWFVVLFFISFNFCAYNLKKISSERASKASERSAGRLSVGQVGGWGVLAGIGLVYICKQFWVSNSVFANCL